MDSERSNQIPDFSSSYSPPALEIGQNSGLSAVAILHGIRDGIRQVGYADLRNLTREVHTFPRIGVARRISRKEALSPHALLAEHLLTKLGAQAANGAGLEAANLAPIAQRFLRLQGELALEMEVASWRDRLASETSSVHDALAELPFQWIVTSNHDLLMEAALRRAKKTPAVEYYDYAGTKKELLPRPTVASPVL